MWELFKNAIKLLFGFIVLFAFASLTLSLLLYLFPKLQQHEIIFDTYRFSSNIASTQEAALILLTIALICVGWLQLGNLNRTSKAEFLLKIVARYSSAEIIEARTIIQEIYRKSNPEKKQVPEETYIRLMSNEIDKIRNNPKSSRKCAALLNLLDFLESISYFTRRNFITVKDIDELIGNSIMFYFKVFKRWIYSRRERYSNAYYYCEFESLAQKIESHLEKEKIAKTCFIVRFLNLFY